MAERTQLERALRLLQLLTAPGWVTVSQLWERLDRRESRRTIQRTLEAVEAAGIRLERRTSAHGEHELRLPAALKVPPHLLSSDEALAALILAQFGGHFTGSRIGAVLDGLVEKLEQLIPCDGVFAQAGLDAWRDAVQVKQPGLVATEGGGLLLRLLESILERRVARVGYRRLDVSEARCFTIHAHSLIFHSGAIYALVWQPEHQSWLHLALQRLTSLEVTTEHFQRQEGFQLADFLNGSFGIWHAEPCHVRLRFDARLRGFLCERIWHPSQQVEELKSGELELTMRVGLSPDLRAWVLRWGPHVEVLEPAAFREEIRLQLVMAAARYLPLGHAPEASEATQS